MNTKLKKWASAFVDYYFKNSTSDKVCLVISKEDIPLVYQFHESYIKFPDRKVNALEEFMRCFMKEKSLPNNPTFKSYHLISKSEFEQSFVEVVEESIKSKQPYYLPYIALFIMPLTDDDIVTEGERRDNYYERLEKFINDTLIPIEGKKQSIKSKKDNWLANNKFPNGIQNNLTKMWGDLQEWICLNFPNKWEFKSSNRHRHIGPFLAEATLTSSQKKRFPKLFIDADIQPNSIISIDEAKHIISSYGKEALTGYSDAEWREITQDDALLEILVDAFFEKYNEWEGESNITNRIKLNNGNKVEQETSSGTSIAVRLIYSEYCGKGNLQFKAFKKDFSEAIDLADGSTLRFKITGWAKEEFSQDVKGFLESDKNCIPLLENNPSGFKATFKKSPVYIFEKENGIWATTNRIRLGESYLVMTPPNNTENLKQWINNNGGSVLKRLGLPEGYTLYRIESITEGFDEIPSLRIRKYPTIDLINGVIISHSGLNKTLSNSKPIEFVVDGISRDDIKSFIAKFEDSEVDLTFDEISRKWRIDCSRVILNKEFKLELNGNKACDRHTYMIINPEIRHNDIPRKNEYGLSASDGIYHGLISSNSKYTLNDKVKALSKDIKPLIFCDIYESQYDEFLYDLSCTENLTEKEFEDIAKQHIDINDDTPNYTDILADLDRNGYIERTLHPKNRGRIITTLPPTLVMMPPAFEEDRQKGIGDKEIVIQKPADSYYKGLLLGGRSVKLVNKFIQEVEDLEIGYNFQTSSKQLMPITISVYSRDWSKLETLAQKLDLHFSNKSFFSAAVLNQIPNIIDYLNEVILKSEPTYKYSSDYRLTRGFKCFDYEVIAEKFNEELKTLCNSNYKIPDIIAKRKVTKSSFDPELDLVWYQSQNNKDFILWYKNKAYHVDYYWGHFVVCALKGIVNIIQPHPNNENILCLPRNLKLPTLVARALTLTTGELPKTENNIRSYRLINNPAMSCLSVKEITNKLLGNE